MTTSLNGVPPNERLLSTRKKQEVLQDNKSSSIEIHQLIDLTDKPIRLTRDEIGWSRVRSNASNCICCCCNNSITLVTTDESYTLDHIPLDNIQYAQTNTSLKYLALSNHHKIAVIDLVNNDIEAPTTTFCSGTKKKNACNNNFSGNRLNGETKLVNLTAAGLTMDSVLFWRWIDNNTLAILSYGALYTCSVDQTRINHPAMTALSQRSQLLTIEKIFELHQHLSTICQITDIQRDPTGNLYAISSLYSSKSLLNLHLTAADNSPLINHPNLNNSNPSEANQFISLPVARLKPSFGSVPSRLSQLVSNGHSFDSLKLDHSFDLRHLARTSSSSSTIFCNNDDEVHGLVQIYCKMRDRSQLIQAHTMTFTLDYRSLSSTCNNSHDSVPPNDSSTILIAANKIGNKMRVHFIGMATSDDCMTSGRNASPTNDFDCLGGKDFPTSIICSTIDTNNDKQQLHIAMITTKYGQLFVCSVPHSTILFTARITHDIISSTVLESKTKGLMAICRNGQVLLVKLNSKNIMKLLEETKRLRHISSSHNVLNSINVANDNRIVNDHQIPSSLDNTLSASLDIGLEVLISTKL